MALTTRPGKLICEWTDANRLAVSELNARNEAVQIVLLGATLVCGCRRREIQLDLDLATVAAQHDAIEYVTVHRRIERRRLLPSASIARRKR